MFLSSAPQATGARERDASPQPSQEMQWQIIPKSTHPQNNQPQLPKPPSHPLSRYIYRPFSYSLPPPSSSSNISVAQRKNEEGSRKL